MIVAISFTSESGDHYLSLLKYETWGELKEHLISLYDTELPYLHTECIKVLGKHPKKVIKEIEKNINQLIRAAESNE